MNRKPWISTRREVLQGALTVGSLAVMSPFGGAIADDAVIARTPRQTSGPFYPITKPLDIDADLTMISGKPGRAQGKIIHLMGRVFDAKGVPVRGARVEIWQANAVGRYAHPGDVNPAPLDPAFQGFAEQLTDSDGQYRFKSIKPAAYPINPMNPGAVRPPHIHFDIRAADSRLVTQMYFPGEEANEGDLIFSRLSRTEQKAVIANVLPPAADDEPDSVIVRWDIVLSRA